MEDDCARELKGTIPFKCDKTGVVKQMFDVMPFSYFF